MERADKALVNGRITLRPAVLPDDEAFLRELYCSTREDLALLFPEGKMLDQMLTIQYQGQKLSYSTQFPDAKNEIIELEGKAVGRILTDRQVDAIRCVDISLLPEAREAGLGTKVLGFLIEECSRSGLRCELQVLKSNRAQNLYTRLGFVTIADDGVRLSMRLSPKGSKK
jgi:ribosomal protein S18 acetylase RimI-like enzyme